VNRALEDRPKSPTEVAALPQERKKVVRIVTRLNVGGPSIHTVLLTALLSPDRYDSVLVTGSEGPTEGSMRYLAEEKGVSLETIPELGREIFWVDDLVALFKLIATMRREKPEIIHTHTAKAGTLGRIAAIVALWGRRRQIFHTFHGHVFHGYFSPLKSRLFILVERFLASFTDQIIAVSERTRDDLIRYRIAPPSKVKCIPLGLDLDRFADCERLRGRLRAEIGVSAETKLVGIVARLVPIKAIDLFLRAARLIRDSGAQVRFVIVGDGELRTDLEAQARSLALAGDVLFLGFRQDLDLIYADLDVAVLCSNNEGLPVSVIEAMSSGCAVVATSVGGVPNLIRDGVTGRLVQPGDPIALADCLQEVLVFGDELQEMRRNAREFALSNFHVSRLVGDIDRLYSG